MTGPGFGQTSLFPSEPAPDPLLCWLWLANTLGAGSSHAGRVLDVFGGAQEAWENRDSDAFRKAVGSPAFARANLPDNTPAHYRAFARRCAARRMCARSCASARWMRAAPTSTWVCATA